MPITGPSNLPKLYLTMRQFMVLFVVIVYFTALWMGRYTVVPASRDGVAYKLDRWTGQVWLLNPRSAKKRLMK